MTDEKLKQFEIESIRLDSYKDIPELKEFDYLLVPLESVKIIIREHGNSCNGCDEICIKQDAPIMFAKKRQRL